MSRLNLPYPRFNDGVQRRVWAALLCYGLMFTLSGCAFPRKDFAGMPDPSVIRLTQHNGQWQAHAPECTPLLQPSQYNAYDNIRMSIAFGCATYSNLAASVARPADLTNPRPFAGTHPDAAALAVQRYRMNDVEPLRETSSTSSPGE